MSSKQILDEGKVADMLIEAAHTNAAEVGARRAARYTSLKLKGAPSAAAIEAQIRLDASVLAHVLATLRHAEDAYAAELGDDAAVFAARDLATSRVREALVDFRDVVTTNCGAAAVAALGFVGETPRDPAALETLGASVLASVERSPPRSKKRGVRFDAKAALEGFDAELAALKTANADVRREKREEQATRSRRDEAWAAFNRERVALARSLEAQLRAVGLDDLADRLLPATRATPTLTEQEPAPTG